jgi:hypothetical protein
VLEKDVGIWFRPFHGPVGTEGVDHDQLIDPADTLKALLDLTLHVETGNDTAYFLHYKLAPFGRKFISGFDCVGAELLTHTISSRQNGKKAIKTFSRILTSDTEIWLSI